MAMPEIKLYIPEFDEKSQYIPVALPETITGTTTVNTTVTFPANETQEDKVYHIEVYVDDVKADISVPTITVKAATAKPVDEDVDLTVTSVTVSQNELEAEGGSVDVNITIGDKTEDTGADKKDEAVDDTKTEDSGNTEESKTDENPSEESKDDDPNSGSVDSGETKESESNVLWSVDFDVARNQQRVNMKDILSAEQLAEIDGQDELVMGPNYDGVGRYFKLYLLGGTDGTGENAKEIVLEEPLNVPYSTDIATYREKWIAAQEALGFDPKASCGLRGYYYMEYEYMDFNNAIGALKMRLERLSTPWTDPEGLYD